MNLVNATLTGAGRTLSSSMKSMVGRVGGGNALGAQAMRRGLKMPSPSIAGPRTVMGLPSMNLTMPGPSHRNVMQGLGSSTMATGMMMSAGIGGVIGGLNSDSGFSMTGAMKGAFGGAVLGASMGVGLPAAAKAMAGNNRFMSTAGSYSTQAVGIGQKISTQGARSALFAGGGLLGGAAFGGTESKRRGFNAHRGNAFSR